MVNKMLLLCKQPKLDAHLCPNQNGFRPKRSTIAHILLALRRLTEGVKRYHMKTVSVEIHQAQEHLKRAETKSTRVGLHVNVKKTQ